MWEHASDNDDISLSDDWFEETEDINDLAAQVESLLEMIFATGDNNNNNNDNNIEAYGEFERNQLNPSSRLHRSRQSPPTDWILREQYGYQRQLGSTSWNLGNPIYLHPFGQSQSKLLLLKRVRACIGWAVHGLIFEFCDGTRVGYVSEVESIHNDEAIDRRRPTDWVYVDHGDYVGQVHGFNLSRECFLCHTIHFEMASGRRISFESKHEPWKGTPFLYGLPEHALLHYVSFQDGQCIGLTAVETIMHLPIQSMQRVMMLPKACQDYYQFLQLVSNQVDNQLTNKGHRSLGRDLWGVIVCGFLACHDLLCDSQPPGTRIETVLQDHDMIDSEGS